MISIGIGIVHLDRLLGLENSDKLSKFSHLRLSVC